MTGGDPGARQLDQTPTWAVSLVCAVIVVISIGLEMILHHVGEWFHKRKKKAMLEALEKIKAELMVLGFISLLLTFGQNYISRICITEGAADTMLPCPVRHDQGHQTTEHQTPGLEHQTPGLEHQTPGLEHQTPGLEHQAPALEHQAPALEHQAPAVVHQPAPLQHLPAPLQRQPTPVEHHRRRILWYEHRLLSAGEAAPACKPGFVPLISLNGLHQLHIFIFFLAVFHVVYSAITMCLGRLKIRGWKAWEQEAEARESALNDPTRFRLTHETSFVRGHTNYWTKTPFLFYLACLYRQFFMAVRKADYITMRNGFVSVHLAPGSKFDFQKYIKRSLEDDFKVVVGISPVLWASAVIFLFVNVEGWYAMFWLSMMPLVVIIAVGTKLQAIITQMAVEIQERHAVVQGIPLVQVSDKHFWFAWPKLVLHLIHLTLFQNAFELTYFFWIWYEFGLRSCFHKNFNLQIFRVIVGIGTQFLCSYITLPLYSLVTQMGSTMKQSIFDEQTSKALKSWHKNALKKKPDGKQGDEPAATTYAAPSGDDRTESRETAVDVGGKEDKDKDNDKDKKVENGQPFDLLTGS